MSVQNTRAEGSPPGTDGTEPVVERTTFLAANSAALLAWLDEQPGFIGVEREFAIKMNRDGEWTTRSRVYKPQTTIRRSYTGLLLVDPSYEPSKRKSFDSQGDVVEAFVDGKFPTHSIAEFDGRAGAELYTLSSYTTDVEGPSTNVPVYRIGRMSEVPASAFVCSECGWTGQTFNRGSWTRRTIRKAEEKAEEHNEAEHGGEALMHEETGHRVTESEKNFRAVQFPDGSGAVEHYSRIESIRTRSGIYLNNRQCFAKGRAHCSKVSNRVRTRNDAGRVKYEEREDAIEVYSLPLNGFREMLDGEPESIYDIADVMEAEDGNRWSSTKVAVLESGRGLAAVYDSTANNWHERICGFVLEPPEVAQLQRANDVEDVLRPNPVAVAEASGLDFVTADEYSGRGGTFYNEDLLGSAVIRQGEWYFIPMDEDWSPDTPVYHEYQRGGWDFDHIDGIVGVDALPRECAECGAARFFVDAVRATCKECGQHHSKAGGVDLTDEDQPFPRRPLGSHYTREVTVDEEGRIYVRGSVRHIENEHKMLNLRDQWHRAAENTKDGVVFDLSTPDRGLGRSGGGIARVE